GPPDRIDLRLAAVESGGIRLPASAATGAAGRPVPSEADRASFSPSRPGGVRRRHVEVDGRPRAARTIQGRLEVVEFLLAQDPLHLPEQVRAAWSISLRTFSWCALAAATA